MNNGQLIEFWVPGRTQNMRWAAYSVRVHVRSPFCLFFTIHSVQWILGRRGSGRFSGTGFQIGL